MDVDVVAFSSSDFNAEQLLAKVPYDEVKAYHQKLEDARQAAAGDLQRNVFKNYVEFVNISKEISALESDILSLRSLLNDLTTASHAIPEQEAILEGVVLRMMRF
ncbi:exocyst complex component exo84 [Phlyctochytrium bullatum]|nr:exocyst complex component exo84 [Phlyctochytrium bullatum]